MVLVKIRRRIRIIKGTRKNIKYLGNVNDHAGGVNKVIEKYGRKFRNGVFYVICDILNRTIKNCCFIVSLLVGLSYLKKDEKYVKMERAPHKGCDDLYTPDQIRNVYQKCGIPPGAVKTVDFSRVYSNFLAEQGVDLVVYSDNYNDNIIYDSRIYDSRTDENGELIQLTDNVVCLWLNNKHYDVVLTMRKFAKLNNFCVKCMSHLGSFEHIDNHICNTKLTCQKCFTQSNCPKDTGYKVECTNCNILFYDPDCFCKTCDKITPRFTFF